MEGLYDIMMVRLDDIIKASGKDNMMARLTIIAKHRSHAPAWECSRQRSSVA